MPVSTGPNDSKKPMAPHVWRPVCGFGGCGDLNCPLSSPPNCGFGCKPPCEMASFRFRAPTFSSNFQEALSWWFAELNTSARRVNGKPPRTDPSLLLHNNRREGDSFRMGGASWWIAEAGTDSFVWHQDLAQRAGGGTHGSLAFADGRVARCDSEFFFAQATRGGTWTLFLTTLGFTGNFTSTSVAQKAMLVFFCRNGRF